MPTRSVKLLEALRRRAKPAQLDLDGLLRLRDAAATLAAAAGIQPSGDAAVALRQANADRFVQLFAAIDDLISGWETPTVELRALDQGSGPYQWITARSDRLDHVVDAVHVLGSGLAGRGFGKLLNAAAFAFATAEGDEVLIVYSFGRGTFYPLARTGDPRRDHALELGVRGATASTLPPEDDRSHRLAAMEVPLPCP